MPKKKKPITTFMPWETMNSSGYEKGYYRSTKSQEMSSAMLALSHTAYRVYKLMRLKCGGQQIFTFPRSYYKVWMSSSSVFQDAKNDLIEKGFIELYEQNKYRQLPNKYKFSEKWKEWKAQDKKESPRGAAARAAVKSNRTNNRNPPAGDVEATLSEI